MSRDITDPYALVGTIVAERFAVEALVSRAPLAVLYRAKHLALGVRALLKVVEAPPRASADGRARLIDRFTQEARVVAALGHPVIARVLDCGALPSALPWMAFEWLDGTALSEELASRAGVGRSPVVALALLRPVLEALACAHDAGVAHRDLRPANLLLVSDRHGAAPIRLIGFGLARLSEDDAAPEAGTTSAPDEVVTFSPRHAAPEQWTRLRTGPWTDVHALALMLTELVVGAAAYRATETDALRAEALRVERPTPGAHGVDVGPWELVLARALSLRGGDRHPSAAALLDALTEALPGAEAAWRRAHAMCPPASVTGRPRPPYRRVAAATFVVLCALVLAATRVGARSGDNSSASARARPMSVQTDASAIRAAPPTASYGGPRVVAPPSPTDAALVPARRPARPLVRARALRPAPELWID